MTNYLKRRSVVLYTVMLVAGFTANGVFASSTEKSLNEYANHGYQLLIAKRFSNAEAVLRQAVEHRDTKDLSSQSRLKLIGLLESSLMYQNKYTEMHEVLSGKFTMMEASGMKPSFEYATSMLNAAESLYYMGQKQDAIETTQASIAMMQSLPAVNRQAIEFAETNIKQYQANRVKNDPVMKDLSHFFTQCENITAGTTMANVQQAFSNNLEVGINYFPKGVMTEVFANATPVGIDRDALKNVERSIFIPDAEHASDWCIVYKDGNTATLAVIAPD